MRRVLIVFFVLLLPAAVIASDKGPDLNGVLRVAGRFAWGHACPTSPITAVTAGHVVDLRPFDRDVSPYALMWSAAGKTGSLYPVKQDWYRDLAYLVPSDGEEFPVWFKQAEHAPAAADKLYILGYDWSERKKLMDDKRYEVTAVRIVAGHLFYSESSKPGSSGGCVLNADGEIVGIVEGSFSSERESSGLIGFAVAFWKGMEQLRPVIRAIPEPAPESR